MKTDNDLAVPIRLTRTLSLALAITIGAAALVRADAYDAPANYYAAATGTGATLKSQLMTITTNGFVSRTYGDARNWMAIVDRDPNNSANILLDYNRASVSGVWDLGVTFNREHVWPKSLLNLTSAQVSNSYAGIASDEFELRPSNPNINSNRSNYGYGYYGASNPAYGTVSAPGGTYFYPGVADLGDSARTIFYMATRYATYGNGLTIVNGSPTTYQMGDLNSLLHWNYADPVDDFERKRNQTIYSSVLNPTYYQGNRNPFIDHPEYVWAIFGTGANTSTLSVGSQNSDGSSNTTANLGRVIAGSSFGTQTLQLNKSGITPTTFDATVSGSASSTLGTPRNTFDYNAGSKTFTVGLTGSTATVGARTGTVTFDNTDLTSAAAGQGVADGNDVVNVTGLVVSHAHPSFSTADVVTTATLDFGIIALGSAQLQGSVDVANQGTAGDFVAGVDVDGSTLSGADAAAFVSANQTASKCRRWLDDIALRCRGHLGHRPAHGDAHHRDERRKHSRRDGS